MIVICFCQIAHVCSRDDLEFFQVNWFGIEDTRLSFFLLFFPIWKSIIFCCIFLFFPLMSKNVLSWIDSYNWGSGFFFADDHRKVSGTQNPNAWNFLSVGARNIFVRRIQECLKKLLELVERIFIETQKYFFEWMMLSYICISKKQDISSNRLKQTKRHFGNVKNSTSENMLLVIV